MFSTSLIVVPSDGTIIVDGEAVCGIAKSLLEWIPNDIVAFHWYPEVQKGEIEYERHPFDEPENIKWNKRVEEIGIFSQAIEVFEQEISRRVAEEALYASQLNSFENLSTEEKLRGERSGRLEITDWIMLPDSPFSDEDKVKWAEYRQKLRDLPSVIEDPLPLVIDPNHPDWPTPPSEI